MMNKAISIKLILVLLSLNGFTIINTFASKYTARTQISIEKELPHHFRNISLNVFSALPTTYPFNNFSHRIALKGSGVLNKSFSPEMWQSSGKKTKSHLLPWFYNKKDNRIRNFSSKKESNFVFNDSQLNTTASQLGKTAVDFKPEADMPTRSKNRRVDVLIIGGGQASLAVSYFLRRSAINYLILDREEGPGGAWRHGWESLRLFSPEKWSSLPGWQMPPSNDNYPSRNHVIQYLSDYEKKYNIPIERPVTVKSITKENGSFIAFTDKGKWKSQVVVSATGTWSNPFIPHYSGRDIYRGNQIHSAFYHNSDQFAGQRVLIVGGGNSGAQILAEVSRVADTKWTTFEEPLFLPDEVDGRILFERATERWKALQQGRIVDMPTGSLANIVMVPSVKEARARNVLKASRPCSHFIDQGVVWQDGTQSSFDSMIWCTGFKPALQHLHELNVLEDDGKVKVNGTRSIKEPQLWLVGYGDWTGYASATLVGVTRTARSTGEEITESLSILKRQIKTF